MRPRRASPATPPRSQSLCRPIFETSSQVLAIARREAQGFNHSHTDTDHLLLGLLVLGSGVAPHVLAKKGLTAEKVRDEIRKSRGTGEPGKKPGDVPYSPRVREALARAQKEAGALDHTYIGTEHLLLALLRERDGGAAHIFKEFKVDAGADAG
jgi:ATP-dependent Clp protease ATP-binding subunit ClpC